MSKYEKYMESEFVGIGKVPTHWEVKRLKHLGEAIIGLTYSPNDVTENEEGILVLRSSNIQEGFIAFDDCVYVNKEVNENLITRKGDILICARNGSAHLVGKNICIDEISAGHTFGAFMVVFRGKYWRYLSYFFNSPIFTSQTGMFSTTTINQLTSQTLNNLRIAYPSDKTEQDNICNYLDDQTQKIDRLIANKKAQAEKLKELRQIEINNAVTKGLNPNVEIKDSGIDWLGEIPKHWEVKRVKGICKIVNGSTPSSSIESYWEGDIIWVTPGDFKNFEHTIGDSESKITDEGYKNCGTSIVPIGSIILTTRAPIGNVLVASKELCTNQGCKSLVPFRINSEFLYYYISVSSIQLNVLGQGTTFLELSTGNLSTFKVPVPPKEEQIQIAKYLQVRTKAIDKLIKNIDAQIEKLQELRKIKIYEAVTGKIKVNAYVEATA